MGPDIAYDLFALKNCVLDIGEFAHLFAPTSKAQLILFGDGPREAIVWAHLSERAGHRLMGYVALAEDTPSVTSSSKSFPEATAYRPEELVDLVEGGAHLLLSVRRFYALVELVGLDWVNRWSGRLHLVKFLLSGGNKYSDVDVCSEVDRIFAMAIDGKTNLAARQLQAFLQLFGPRSFSPRERLRELATHERSLLPIGNIAIVFLAAGDLEKGWMFYEDAVRCRVREKCPPLPQPFWAGEEFGGRRIVFRRERGPGDEICYSHIFKDLIDIGCLPIIEVDPRMVGLFRRSFPGGEVVPRGESEPHPRLLDGDIELQANYSDPFRYFRDRIGKFPDHNGYLIPDPDRVRHWHERLAQVLPEGPRVGIAWGTLAGSGSGLHTTSLREWASVLTRRGVNFVNLQYGDVRDELDWVRKELGTTVYELEDLDLFNDLESLAAVIANLDLVISIHGVNAHLAGAIGTPVWQIVGDYIFFHCGQDYDPFYPRARVFQWKGNGPRSDALDAAARMLSEVTASAGTGIDARAHFRELAPRSRSPEEIAERETAKKRLRTPAVGSVNADSYYGARVKTYDADRCRTLRWAREMGAVAEMVTQGPVLDCPVGTGRFVGIYRDRGLEVTGVDISHEMLAEAKRIWPDLDTRQGTVFELEFDNAAFEVAVCVRLLDWLDPSQMEEALRELRRVARTLVVSIRTGTEGIVTNWTHDLSRFYAAIDGLYIAARVTTEETERYGREDIYYLRPPTWDDALHQFRFHGRTLQHEMQRLANEWFEPLGLPELVLSPATMAVHAEYWTAEQIGIVIDGMGAFDSRYITDLAPIDIDCPATVLSVDGRDIVLDGRRRFNLWRTQPGLHPVLVIRPKA